MSPDLSHLEESPPHDGESSTPEVEEVTGGSHSNTRPPSIDSLDDGRPINERLQEIRDLVTKLKQLKHHTDYLSVAPPLHAELVEKINKLLDFTSLSDLQSLYRPELLDHVETAAQIRTTFSRVLTQDDPLPRRRSSSEGDMGVSPQLTLPATGYSSKFAQRLSLAAEPVEDVFHNTDLPMVQQPGTLATTQNPTENQSFTAEQHFSVSLDALIDRLSSAEAKWEQHADETKSEVKGQRH